MYVQNLMFIIDQKARNRISENNENSEIVYPYKSYISNKHECQYPQ